MVSIRLAVFYSSATRYSMRLLGLLSAKKIRHLVKEGGFALVHCHRSTLLGSMASWQRGERRGLCLQSTDVFTQIAIGTRRCQSTR
jgi:hypothetical protein